MSDVFDLSAILNAQAKAQEEYLIGMLEKLGITPEQFVEQYHLEEYPPTLELMKEHNSDVMKVRFTSNFRIFPNLKYPSLIPTHSKNLKEQPSGN